MRPYIHKPAVFTMLLESVKKKVEELRVQTEKAAPHSDPEKVKELLKLIQLNKSSKGKAGDAEAAEDTYTLKRKVDLDAHEGSSKRQRNQPSQELREGEENEDFLFLSIYRGKKILDPLLILYVCPLTKKLSVYNFNRRFI